MLNILNTRASGWVLPLAIVVLTLLLLTFSVQSWLVSRSVFDNEIAHINRVALQNARSVMISRRESFSLLGQQLSALNALDDPEAGRDILEKVAFFTPGIVSLGLARTDGTMILYSNRYDSAYNPVTLPNLQQQSSRLFSRALNSDDVVTGPPLWQNSTREWMLPLFYAFRSPYGDDVAGVLTGLVRLQDRLARWDGVDLGHDTSVVVVSSDGVPRYAVPVFNAYDSQSGRQFMMDLMQQVTASGEDEGWLVSDWSEGRSRTTYRVHFSRIGDDLFNLVVRPQSSLWLAWRERVEPALLAFFALLAGSIGVHRIVLRQQKIYQHNLLYQAHHDPLTGLLNRAHLLYLMKESMADDPEVAFSLLIIDLDYFNRINDQHGHAIGDALLKLVPQRLQGILSPGDWLARQGGDEFLVVFRNELSFRGRDVLTQAVKAALEEEFEIHNRVISVSASIGVANFPRDAIDPNDLLGKANAALYQAKGDGRNCIVHYSDDIAALSLRSKELERQLDGCWQRNEMQVYYQPQVDCRSGALIGAEALVRWKNNALGDVSPAEFIPVAEAIGAVRQIDRFVMAEACAFIHDISRQFSRPLRISINLSPAHLLDPAMIAEVTELIRRYDLAPQQLVLEITETAVLNDFERAAQQVSQLRELGVGVSVDDFGTGYSSLSYIHKLPVTEIKIDRSFVDQIATDLHDRALTSAVIAMGKRLHLEVVAEGVETANQWQILLEQHCDTLQGFYIARPMPAEDFIRFMENHLEQPQAIAQR
ncbi:MAG: EAL domain-containing protein [Saccharospirillaceae bacterium]|nr:EAL domain-containing protein [Saccharospirillaceae bacterium]MCD8532780.1 EAL domain-containing protein [Saccharospirillaceae bacterium]